MIMYFSGFGPGHFYDKAKELDIKHYLYSFYNFQKKELKERYSSEYKIFIDSGGYSARVKGIKIDIMAYINFLNKNADYIEVAANLDTNDIEETLKNQKLLMDRVKGVTILPIYHVSDYINPKYKGLLDEFIKKYEYIGVGGIAGVSLSEKQRTNFLNYVFSKTKGKIKVHGFGITSIRLVQKFPFYSVDSTSWQAGMRYGNAFSPQGAQFSYKNMKQVVINDVPAKLLTASYLDRVSYDLIYWSNFEKKITKLWEIRGVFWKD